MFSAVICRRVTPTVHTIARTFRHSRPQKYDAIDATVGSGGALLIRDGGVHAAADHTRVAAERFDVPFPRAWQALCNPEFALTHADDNVTTRRRYAAVRRAEVRLSTQVDA